MQKIIIGICDDEKSTQNLLYNYLDEYAQDKGYEFEIYTFAQGEALLDSKEVSKLDLLLLDIEMEKINGIETAHLLRGLMDLNNLQIVFVSAYDKYMRSMFDVRPFQYISKPVVKEKLFNTMDVFCSLFMKKSEYFSFKIGKEVHRVPCQEIIYFESCGRKVRLHTNEKCFEFYEKLNVLEKVLEGACFCRIHQSYMVNPQYIDQYSAQQVVMQNGERIPVSGKYKKSFIKMQFSS